MLCADPDSEVKKSVRLQKKVMLLLYDLVLNDDNIKLDDKNYVRRTLGSSEDFIRQLLHDLEHSKDQDLRETILKVLFRVHQYMPTLGDILKPRLFFHRAQLASIG